MHAVGRLALHPVVKNIQTSWVKMGRGGAAACLKAGANDLGGTLMNESITRAAGAVHGEEMSPQAMEDVIASLGRRPRQRTTLYGEAAADRIAASFNAMPLRPPPVVQRGGSRAAPEPLEDLWARENREGEERGWKLASACQQRRNPGRSSSAQRSWASPTRGSTTRSC